ncbi:MAG: STAS domain-containing protein [Gallionella sp.]|nr:STAS domain-containing protein [Gallionella sp.]
MKASLPATHVEHEVEAICFETDEKAGLISIHGRFDFNTHRHFRHAYELLIDNRGLNDIEIELSGVNYIDSSALGMLMLLRERAGKANKTVSLVTSAGVVEQVLNVANFDRIFSIRNTQTP